MFFDNAGVAQSVGPQPSKLQTSVRFRSPAPSLRPRDEDLALRTRAGKFESFTEHQDLRMSSSWQDASLPGSKRRFETGHPLHRSSRWRRGSTRTPAKRVFVGSNPTRDSGREVAMGRHHVCTVALAGSIPVASTNFDPAEGLRARRSERRCIRFDSGRDHHVGRLTGASAPLLTAALRVRVPTGPDDLLRCRSTVGRWPLEPDIGVRIPTSQPRSLTRSAAAGAPRS
jgi:hypothetical protein